MKILIIRFSSIGDIVITTAAVRCIRNHFPDAEIHFLTKEEYKSIVSPNLYINKVLTLQDSLVNTVFEIRKQRYDIVFDLHKNLRTFCIKIFSGSRVVSFDKINFEKWLMTAFKIDRLPQKHLAERYFDALKEAGVEDDGKGLDYFITDNDKEASYAMPFAGSDYITWAIGAKQKTKQFPAEKIIAALKMPEFLNKKVVLLGGKEDVGKAYEITAAVGSENIYSMVGKLTLGESAAVVKNSKVLITNDTGLMHIAAALKVSIISIWGNTIPKFGMYPYYGKVHLPHSIIEAEEVLKCRPCSKLGYEKCPEGHFRCMQSISVKRINEALLRLY